MAAPIESNAAVGLKGKIYSGLYWGTIGRGFQQAIQFFFTVALSRLLTPGDYGLMAMVSVFTGFAAMLADGGFNSALVQRQKTSDAHLHTVFWLNVSSSVLLAAATFLLAPSLARFFSAPSLAPLFRVIAANFVLGSLGSVAGAILEKRMQFKAIALNLTAALTISGLVGLGLAFIGAGVWSLVAQSLAFSASYSALRCWSCRWLPRGVFDLGSVKDLIGFSGNFYAFNFINYWARNADNLMVGKFFGASSLGAYNRAYTLMLLPISQINSIVAQVVFPAFSSIQDDRDRIRTIYLRAIGLVALLAFPLMMGLEVTAEPFVATFYGGKWSSVVPFVQILAPVGMLQAIGNSVGWIYLAQGRTKLLLLMGTLNAVGEIISFGIGIWLGSPVALAACYALFNLAFFYPSMLVAWRILDIRASQVFAIIGGPFACSVAMGAVVYGLGKCVPPDWKLWAAFALLVSVGVLAYAAAVLLCRLTAANDFITLVSSRLKPGNAPAK